MCFSPLSRSRALASIMALMMMIMMMIIMMITMMMMMMMISSRSRVLASIMARVTGGGDQGVVVDKLLSYSSSVAAEETQLKLLKNVLGTQVRTRTI